MAKKSYDGDDDDEGDHDIRLRIQRVWGTKSSCSRLRLGRIVLGVRSSPKYNNRAAATLHPTDSQPSSCGGKGGREGKKKNGGKRK